VVGMGRAVRRERIIHSTSVLSYFVLMLLASSRSVASAVFSRGRREHWAQGAGRHTHTQCPPTSSLLVRGTRGVGCAPAAVAPREPAARDEAASVLEQWAQHVVTVQHVEQMLLQLRGRARVRDVDGAVVLAPVASSQLYDSVK
jgi:hypothetical protein